MAGTKEPYRYLRRKGTEGGYMEALYEMNLTKLFLLREMSKTGSLILGTNVDQIGNLDDVVLRYESKDESGRAKSKVVFLQLKYKENPAKDKITVEKLKKDGDFSLIKYLVSYFKIQEKFSAASPDPIFRGKFNELDCEFVIYTNAVLDKNFELRKVVVDEDSSFLCTNNDGKIVRCVPDDDDMGFLTDFVSEYPITLLAQRFSQFVFGRAKYGNMMKDELMKDFHVFLAENVIGVDKGVTREISKEYRRGEFKEAFFKTDDLSLKIFRKALYKCKEVEKLLEMGENFDLLEDIVEEVAELLNSSEEIDIRNVTEEQTLRKISMLVGSVLLLDKKKRLLRFAKKTSLNGKALTFVNNLEQKISNNLENYTFSNVDEITRFRFPKDIKLPVQFGNVNPTLKDVEKLATSIVNLLEQFECSVIKIEEHMIGKNKILGRTDLGEIKRLVGHLLVLSKDNRDKENVMLKFTDRELLSEDAKKLVIKVREKMENRNLCKYVLEDYRFFINVRGFPKLSLVHKTEEIVQDFLGKLKFFTNQANEHEVENTVKNEILQYFVPDASEEDAKFIFDFVHEKVEKYWKGENANRTDCGQWAPYLPSGAFFEEAKLRLYEKHLDNSSVFYKRGTVARCPVSFREEEVTALKQLIDSKQVIHLIVCKDAVMLCCTKFYQLLDASEPKKAYIFISLDPEYQFNITECLDIFKSRKDILIIESQSAKKYSEIPCEHLLKIMNASKEKRVILITPEDSVLSATFQEVFSDKYVRKWEESSFIDLDMESQAKILEEKVIFQKKHMSLKEVLDVKKDVGEFTEEELYRLDNVINSKALLEIICNKTIEIGIKQPDVSDLESIYYVASEKLEKEQLLETYASSSDLFVISGTTEDQFLQFIPELNFEKIDRDRFIMLTSRDEDENLMAFKEVCSSHAQQVVHLIKKEGDDLTWKRTYNTTFYIPSELCSVVISADSLMQYCKKNQTDIFAINIQNDFIILNDENEDIFESFEDVCSIYNLEKCNIHLLQNKTRRNLDKLLSNELFWECTKGNVDNILQLRAEESTFPVCENRLDRIINSEKNVVIAANPGIGKTTMLTHLFGQPNEPHWVIYLSLNNDGVQKLFEKIKPKDLSSSVEFFSQLDIGIKGSLSKGLLQHRMNHGKIVLLLDGFDEIKCQSQDLVIELLNYLRNTEVKVRMTTRPHMKYVLEKALCTFSYSVKTFSKNEQQEFLRKFWKSSFRLTLHNVTDEVLNKNSDKLLEHFNRNINDRYEFMATPLLTRMFAEVYQDVFKKSCNPNSRVGLHIPETEQNFSVVDLFEKFVERKYDRYFKEKIKMTNDPYLIRNVTKALNKDHQHLSFCRLFPEYEHTAVFLDRSKFDQEDVDALKMVGIVYSTGAEGDLTFIHRTFAEYFCAALLVSLVEKPERDQKCKLACEFLCKCIFSEEKIINDFFNYMLAKNLPVHHAAFDGELETISNAVCIDTQDRIGRTPLCYALSNYQVDTVVTLLQKNAELNISNVFLREAIGTFLARVAYYRESLQIIEVLVKKIDTTCLSQEEIGTLFDKKFGGMTALQSASKCGESGLRTMELLVSKGANLSLEDRDGQTVLQRAVQGCQWEVVEFLVINGADCNYIHPQYKNSPLSAAVYNGAPVEIIKFLIMQTATKFFDTSDVYGLSHLSYIVGCMPLYYNLDEIAEVIALLVNKGVNLNVRDKTGATPLCTAIFERQQSKTGKKKVALFTVAKLLLERGAVYTWRTTTYAKTPLELAMCSDLADDMYQMLSTIDKLFVAVQRAPHSITNLLTSARARNITEAVTNAHNHLGYSVFEFACEHSYPDSQSHSIKALLSEGVKYSFDLNYLSGVSELFCSQS